MKVCKLNIYESASRRDKLSSLSNIHDHTQTRHTGRDSSGRVIISSQRPLPEKIQHPRKTDVHAPEGLRRIINTKWNYKITNEELQRIAHQKSIENQTKRRKRNCIGHTLRIGTGTIEKTALEWNRQGIYKER